MFETIPYIHTVILCVPGYYYITYQGTMFFPSLLIFPILQRAKETNQKL